ncbi:MAG: Asp23/Gls24 family envelope stress response protein [Coriobacteriia bacterium]|nr:Asp23/Gls24 family envelope stress response protein [Coriobacteriia bacterium]
MSKDIPGGLSISNNAIADAIGHEAMEIYGVVGMSAPSLQDGIAKILPQSKYRRGIIVSDGETGPIIDLYVVLEYGTNITAVSENLRDRAEFVLKNIFSISADEINVHVQGMKVRK